MNKKLITLIILILLAFLGSFFIGYSENKLVNNVKLLVPSIKNFVKQNIFYLRSNFSIKQNIEISK